MFGDTATLKLTPLLPLGGKAKTKKTRRMRQKSVKSGTGDGYDFGSGYDSGPTLFVCCANLRKNIDSYNETNKKIFIANTLQTTLSHINH